MWHIDLPGSFWRKQHAKGIVGVDEDFKGVLGSQKLPIVRLPNPDGFLDVVRRDPLGRTGRHYGKPAVYVELRVAITGVRVNNRHPPAKKLLVLLVSNSSPRLEFVRSE